MDLFKKKKVFKIVVKDKKLGRSITFPINEQAYKFITSMNNPKIVGFKEEE